MTPKTPHGGKTRGGSIMASVFDSYAPIKGEVKRRNTGSLIAFETGEAVAYGLWNAQDRGALFIIKKAPLCKGGCRRRQAVTEGLIDRPGTFNAPLY